MELFEEYTRENPLSNKYLSNLIQKFVLTDAYRNSSNPAKAIENELNRAPQIAYEKAFRDAVDRCIRASRKMRDKIIAVAQFYKREDGTKIPTKENRIEHIINPLQSGHCHDLENLIEALKPFKPGCCPGGVRHLDRLLHIVANDIHQRLTDILPAHEINDMDTDYSWLIGYLKTPKKNPNYAEHCATLKDLSVRIQKRFCKISNRFTDLTGEIITERKLSAQHKAKAKAKKVRLGKGPQTDYKKRQRDTFEKFLERHPITPSQSAITRAHQCWLEHKKEWDEAAKRGEGYSCYKALAQAF